MGTYQKDRHRPVDREAVGLPVRPFLYSVDQIATLLSLTPKAVYDRYLFYEGRSTGVPPRDLLRAVNIAPVDTTPEWRVAERELIRWMKVKGFRYYEPGSFTH
jgi:hypothetical protein